MKERREARRNHEFRQEKRDELARTKAELELARLKQGLTHQEDQRVQEEMDRKRRTELEERRFEEERMARWEAKRDEERRELAKAAGAGSGGYMVVELAEKERPFFHDLLKGFEDYAKLKGYELSFSIDSSFEGRIAFKFTVKNDGVVVGTERVRRDFREYLERVRSADLEALDNLPTITSLEEHSLLVTLLKNRISFLQHSYQLTQATVRHYEALLNNMRMFPALPAPSVVVHTGGSMDSRSYKAVNSPRLIQGDNNEYTESSINIDIGRSFNEKQERVAQLDDVIKRLEDLEGSDEAAAKATRELTKVKDELTGYPEPNISAIKQWMGRAKQLLATAALGAEVTNAAHRLFRMFGLS